MAGGILGGSFGTPRTARCFLVDAARGQRRISRVGRVLHGLDRYLASLPRGLDSYPEAGVKGTIVRSVLTHSAVPGLTDVLTIPEAVRRLIREPPLASEWASEVHFNALSCALVDTAFDGPDGLHAYELWIAELSRHLFRTPLYRVLFAAMSPSHLLAAISMRWGAFHRGSSLTHVRGSEPDLIEVRLTMPAHLEPAPILHATSGGFRAAIEATRGVVTSLRWVAESPTSVRWQIRWTAQ
jgi:hypothetical protein